MHGPVCTFCTCIWIFLLIGSVLLLVNCSWIQKISSKKSRINWSQPFDRDHFLTLNTASEQGIRMSYRQIYCLFKAVKHKKITKMTKGPPVLWLPSSPLLRKFDRETINATYIKKDLVTSVVVFMPKSPKLLPRNWFLHNDDAPVHTTASVKEFKCQRRH